MPRMKVGISKRVLDSAPARKARPDSHNMAAQVAAIIARVPTTSHRGGPDAARPVIRNGVKGGNHERYSRSGVSGRLIALDRKIIGTASISIMGPTRVWASRGVSQNEPTATKIEAYIT